MNAEQQKQLEEFLTEYAVEHTGDKKAVVRLSRGRWALGCWLLNDSKQKYFDVAEWVGTPSSDLNYVKRRIRNSVEHPAMAKTKTTKTKCEWCDGTDDPIWAEFRVSYCKLDGTLIEMVNLCESCVKRGVTLHNEKTIEPCD